MAAYKQLSDNQIVRMGLLSAAGIFGLIGLLLAHGFHATELTEAVATVCSGIALLLFLAEQAFNAATIRPWRRYLKNRWPRLIWTKRRCSTSQREFTRWGEPCICSSICRICWSQINQRRLCCAMFGWATRTCR